jgi:branched-chain amino acid transport system ATP-binding protein
MGQIWNRRLSRKIDTLTTKINFNEQYLEYLIQKKQNLTLKKINNFEEGIDKKLAPLAIAANIKFETNQLKEKALIEKFEKKYYWKKRAVTTSKKRAIAKDGSSKEIAKKFDTKIELLEEELAKKKQAIVDKFHPTSTDLASKVALFNQEKDTLEKQLQQHIRILKQKESDYIEQNEQSFVKKDTKLKAKKDKYTQKLNKRLGSEGKKLLDDKVLLKVDNLSMKFGGLKAIDDLSFEVKKGEIFGLIGPNGAGKTTVFNCITRFYTPTTGTIYFSNRKNETIKLNDVKVHNVIKQGIIRTFQNVELIWELSVLDNLLVAGHTLYHTNFFGHILNLPRLKHEEIIMRKKALEILKKLNLEAYQHALPLGLPYGILKRIELARTLMINPSLIILDEPAAGLNDVEKVELAQTIKKIQKEYDATIFLVEHDMGLVMGICDTICAISFGKKLAIGTPSEIQQNQLVKEAYLGGE